LNELRAWFEGDSLVHFIKKDFHECSTENAKIFENDKNDIPLVWNEKQTTIHSETLAKATSTNTSH